jgi:hypothetical protein
MESMAYKGPLGANLEMLGFSDAIIIIATSSQAD